MIVALAWCGLKLNKNHFKNISPAGKTSYQLNKTRTKNTFKASTELMMLID